MGDSCSWYKDHNYKNACSDSATYKNGNGVEANQACCHCGGGVAGTTTVWATCNNFCVSESSENLQETRWPAGSQNIAACKDECNTRTDCSAIEWYAAGWSGSKCYLILDSRVAKKCNPAPRWRDAACYFKPNDRVIYERGMGNGLDD